MSSAGRIRVMVVDDHPIMRDSLRNALEASGRFEVVGLAEDGEESVREAQNLRPDVIIMDVMMPGKDGIEACREIMELLPETRVLILTASNAEGRLRIPENAVRQVFSMVRGLRELASRQALDRLTAVERETLTLFAKGMPYTEIAQVRGNTPLTVRNTLYRIQDKLGVETKQGLVSRAATLCTTAAERKCSTSTVTRTRPGTGSVGSQDYDGRSHRS